MRILYIATACVALLFSCSKDDKNTQPEKSKIAGTWTFVNLSVSTNTTWTHKEGKDVYFTDYVSTGNTGTLTFTTDSLLSANYGYSYDYQTKTLNYTGSELTDSSVYNGSYTVEPRNSAATFSWISSDSIRIAAGKAAIGDSSFASLPTSYVISWAGDTLLLTTREDTTQVYTDQVETAVRQQSISVIRLIKK